MKNNCNISNSTYPKGEKWKLVGKSIGKIDYGENLKNNNENIKPVMDEEEFYSTIAKFDIGKGRKTTYIPDIPIFGYLERRRLTSFNKES